MSNIIIDDDGDLQQTTVTNSNKRYSDMIEEMTTEKEINLASAMLIYSVFVSDQEVKNMKIQELITKLRYFFSQEVLDEAAKRITGLKKEKEK